MLAREGTTVSVSDERPPFVDPLHMEGEQRALTREHLEFANHWKALARSGCIPSRDQLDLKKIKGSLSGMVLSDVVDGERPGGGTTYRYRLAGSSVVAAFDKELTGLFVHENPYEICRIMHLRLFDHVRAVKEPIYTSTLFCYPSRRHLVATKTVYPLSQDGVTVDKIAMVQTLSFSDKSQEKIYDEEMPSSSEDVFRRMKPGERFRLHDLSG